MYRNAAKTAWPLKMYPSHQHVVSSYEETLRHWTGSAFTDYLITRTSECFCLELPGAASIYIILELNQVFKFDTKKDILATNSNLIKGN